MRNAVLFHLYGGDALISLFALLAIVVALDVCGLLSRNEIIKRVARVFALASLPLGALTGTPVSVWLLAPLIVVWLAYSLIEVGDGRKRGRIVGVVFVILSAGVVVPETLYLHSRPGRHVSTETMTIAVLGDSLTSGGFGETRRWTDHLENRGLTIVDLSSPSATVGSALRYQVPEIPSTVDAVIVELGGNDMLDGTPRSEFAETSQAIIVAIRRVTGANKPIFVIEFPVLPGKWSWAAAQRRVSRNHDVQVIPKRILARVLLTPGNTIDGLHLTDRGHEALASEIDAWVR